MNGKRREISMSICCDAIIQHHLIQAEQIPGGRIQAPTRRREHGALTVLRRVAAEYCRGRWPQLAVLLHVNHCDAVYFLRWREEKGVLHPERLQDMVRDEILIFFAGADFDDPAEDFNTRTTVAPLGSRLK